MAKSTYGTGCFMLLNTGEAPLQSRSGMLTTPACQINGRGLIQHPADTAALAAK